MEAPPRCNRSLSTPPPSSRELERLLCPLLTCPSDLPWQRFKTTIGNVTVGSLAHHKKVLEIVVDDEEDIIDAGPDVYVVI
jgi:hypothetical protein